MRNSWVFPLTGAAGSLLGSKNRQGDPKKHSRVSDMPKPGLEGLLLFSATKELSLMNLEVVYSLAAASLLFYNLN
jgi:hypothetical protein